MRRSIIAAAGLAAVLVLGNSVAIAGAQASKPLYTVDLASTQKAAPAPKAKKSKATTTAPFVITEATPIDPSCRAKAPGTSFDSVHEYTCAYQLFRAFSIVLADPAKRAEFDKLWAPEVVKNAPELKMDGVADADRIANTFAMIRRMRDFTHERFDYVHDAEQSAARQKQQVRPALEGGGIGVSLRLNNDWQIRQQLFGSIKEEDKIPYAEFMKKMDEAMVIGPGHELIVDAVMPSGPSVGVLKGGDVIVGVIDDKGEHLFSGMKESDAIKLIRGTLGSSVTLKILRTNSAGRQIPVDFVLQRSKVRESAVTVHDENGIRHITVANFENEMLVDDFYNALTEGVKLGVKGIDIDLRGNPGGRLDYVTAMLEMVVPRGLILTTKQREVGSDKITQTDYTVNDGYVVTAQKDASEADTAKKLDAEPRVAYSAKWGQAAMQNPQLVYKYPLAAVIPEDMPITVQVDVNSYSASEIFAGAIKATKRGAVVGEPSAGKGAIMPEIGLPEGGALDITNGQFFPGGLDTKHKGVIPDIIVEEAKDYGKTDNQKAAATAWLLDQAKQLEAKRALETERTKINDQRFEDEMAKRDASDLKAPKDQDQQQ